MFECKTEKQNRQCEHGQTWRKQEAWFARVTHVWLTVNHDTSVTTGKWTQCSKQDLLYYFESITYDPLMYKMDHSGADVA